MCEAGNQTIFRECKEAIKKQLNGVFTNQAARALLQERGGCMVVKHKRDVLNKVLTKA